MKTSIKLTAILLALCAAPSIAAAQATGTPDFVPYDPAGEVSPGTSAPNTADMVAAIEASSPTALAALLEYGERVECHACVPLLQRRMLNPNTDPLVREMAAWWLRRRPFGFGAVMYETRTVLASDPDPARRAVAAEAIGEFMDFHGVAHLATALENDSDTRVRVAAVHGLARINSPSVLPLISQALRDSNADVQEAALRSIPRLNFFADHEALIPLLASDRGAVRRGAAELVGALRVTDALPALSAMVLSDDDVLVRQASAWALGKLRTAEARAALNEARGVETSRRVLDAIDVALAMR